MTTQRIPGARFLGRNPGGGICTRRNRDLTTVTYLIDIDGAEVVMGKRCASRTMGWATTRVEMEAVSLLRVAEVGRRREVVFAAYPHLRAVWDQFAIDVAEYRAAGFDPSYLAAPTGYAAVSTASTTDWMWGDEPSWVEYIDSCLTTN